MELKMYEDFLQTNYLNENTRKQYYRCAENFNRIYNTIVQDNLNAYLKKYTNNELNRAFLKTLLICFNLYDLRLPVIKSRKKRKVTRKLTISEIEALVAGLPPKLNIMVKLMFETGLRLNELMSLKFPDIDLQNRIVKGLGKGNKEFSLNFSPQTNELLKTYLSHNLNPYPFHYLFIKHQNQKFWYYLKKESAKIGFKNIHPHLIRHSLGYYLRAVKKFDVEQVRERLRHISIATTQIYTSATQEEVSQKMDAEVFNVPIPESKPAPILETKEEIKNDELISEKKENQETT